MKKSLTSILLLTFFTVAFAGKALVVTQKFIGTAGGQNTTVTWYISQSQCKMKMQFNDKDVNNITYFLPDIKTNNLLTYSDGPVPAGLQKTYFSIPASNIKGTGATAVTVERTGETKIISEMNCEKIMVKSENSITEMWVTKDFKTDFYKFANFFQNSSELKGLNVEKIQGVPLTSKTTDLAGNVISAYELISATPTELTENDFKVPAEFKSAEEINKAKN